MVQLLQTLEEGGGELGGRRFIIGFVIIKKQAHNYLNTTRNTRASLPRASAQTMRVHHICMRVQVRHAWPVLRLL